MKKFKIIKEYQSNLILNFNIKKLLIFNIYYFKSLFIFYCHTIFFVLNFIIYTLKINFFYFSYLKKNYKTL
jgi:hypothetical protein